MSQTGYSPPALQGGSLPVAALAGRGAGRWRPGSASAVSGVLHSEIFGAGDEGGAAVVALAFALDEMRAAGMPSGDSPSDRRMILWVQDKTARRLGGRPYRPGLPAPLRDRLIHVAAATAQDALFALEEGLRCRDLACVIGEVAGNPKALDFTASRRLSLAAERHGVPLFLVRLDARRDLSSARMRWQVRSAASPPPRWNAAAPGSPTWQAELFRARAFRQGEWVLRDDGGFLSAEPFAGRTLRQARGGERKLG